MFNQIKNIKKIHFIGIGGSGMSGIAEVLLNIGYEICGSDLKRTDVTQRLEKMGVKILYKHEASNIKDCDVVVVSTAISQDNPEFIKAKDLGIPVISRGEMLAELMRMKSSIAIAGTHGKTTTTSMVSWILSYGGLDPTIVIGGRLNNIGSSAKLGQGDFIIAEADESDGSFLRLNPIISVVTNIDNDHLDYYKNMQNLKNAFIEFINKIPFYSVAVLCNDNENIRSIIPSINRKFFTYGIKEKSDIMAKNITKNSTHTIFDVYFKGKCLDTIHLPLIGEHNVYNALAAILVSIELGIEINTILEAFKKFKGVGRRLEIKGEKKGVLVLDDYGHHPREIEATWNSVKNFWDTRKKSVIFQPHRYSRTKLLAKEFARVLEQMDEVYLMPIYPAGEAPLIGVDSRIILKHIKKSKQNNIHLVATKEDLLEHLLKKIEANSLILTLGAGNVVKVGEELLEKI